MPEYIELEVSLLRARPRIWRRFQLRSDSTFLEFRRAIQHACGWQDYHLFRFQTPQGDAVAGIPDTEWRKPDPDAARVRVSSYFAEGDRCIYLYDFGDN